jgi:putative tricarboxylic transport membrane protein
MASNDTQSNSSGDKSVIGTNTVELIVSLGILGLAILLGWDSYRSGNGWADNAPQAGYFPFYLSLVMGLAALYGLISTLITSIPEQPFVTREQFMRVIQVFIPTLIFCGLTQFTGIYVASFLLTSGFMWWVGRISLWVSVLTGVIFAVAMFGTFEIAFNVLLPKGPLEAALGY